MIYLEMLNTEEERQQFEEIYQKYYKDMYFCANQILKSKELTEDAVHMSFLKLLEHFERYQDLPEQKWRTLCIVVAKNTSLDFLKKESNVDLTQDEEFFDYQNKKEDLFQQNPQLDIMLAEEAKMVMKEALKQLPERGKMIITLYYMEQLSAKEIAELLDIKENYVNIQLYRMREKLKKILEKGDYFDVGKADSRFRGALEGSD